MVVLKYALVYVNLPLGFLKKEEEEPEQHLETITYKVNFINFGYNSPPI